MPHRRRLRFPGLLLLGFLLLSACDMAPPREDNPARLAFERGYVYLHPDDRQLYAVDVSDLENPFLLTNMPGIQAFSLSRDARQVVFVARPEQAAGQQLYVLSVQGGTERVLVPHSALPAGSTLLAPRFSPSGERVAFGYSDGPGAFHIALVNADGSGLRRLGPGFGALLPGNWFSPNFSSEQTLWVVSIENGQMVLIEMDTATGVELNRRSQVGVVPLAPSSRLVLSPGGEYVAWAGNPAGGRSRIFVWELNAGAVRQLTEHNEAEAEDSMPSWKDRTTVVWTTQKAGAFHAYSAGFRESNTAGRIEKANALHTVYGP